MSERWPHQPKRIKMGWEWNWPHRLFSGSHWGLYFDFRIQMEGDHAPGVWLNLTIGRWAIIDCGYYNEYHEEENE